MKFYKLASYRFENGCSDLYDVLTWAENANKDDDVLIKNYILNMVNRITIIQVK